MNIAGYEHSHTAAFTLWISLNGFEMAGQLKWFNCGDKFILQGKVISTSRVDQPSQHLGLSLGEEG